MRPLLALTVAAALAAAGERPRLLVVVSVDQMRPDTLTRFAKEYRGGLKRLLDRGRCFNGILDHAATQTGPGHSTMLTGCRPATTGIVANSWLDRATLKPVYCVGDQDAAVFGVPGKGRSPKLLLRSALGDWMKAADRQAKVFGISCKDRAAILMGGQKPDGAYWLEKSGPGFTTSAYYAAARPGWLDAGEWLAQLPESWTYEPVNWLRPDDDPRESSRFRRAAPHPLATKDQRKLLERVYASPYGDELTLLLARRIVEKHDLGGDAATDLLAISLSATDTVGHLYGPMSQEIRDTQLRIDEHLGAFFEFLDERGVTYVVVLTADHGVLAIPDMNRVESLPLLQKVNVGLQRRVGAADWFRYSGGQIYLNPKHRTKKVREAMVAVLREQEVMAAVFDRSRIAGEEQGGLLELVRRSYHPDRSGDIFAIPKPNVLITSWGTGTSHGSPHRYDREVPLIFFGPDIVSGELEREARTIDIAPTLAGLIGVAVPEGVEGEALPLE